jgi:uncharacterized protein involved in exopolysaccharide biosynthesis
MTTPDTPSSAPPETTLLRLTAAVVRRAPLIIACAVAGAIIAAAISLVVRERYQASARVALEERTMTPGAGGLAALASQFGAGALSGTRSLQFYADVVTGRDLLARLAHDSFPDPADSSVRRPLVEILDVPGDSPARRLSTAIDYLQMKAIRTATNDRTGILTITVELPHAALSAQVARRLYERLEQFNFATRRSAATERREFAEREVARTRAELASAENEMRAFLEANRAGLDVPRLQFQRERIQRRLSTVSDVYQGLVTELQEARIAEVRDLPVFTLVQTPAAPLDRVFPKRKQMTILGLLAGAALGVLWVAVRATGWSARSLDPEGYQQLRSAVRRAR